MPRLNLTANGTAEVSVIIPTYNRALVLGRALESVFNQSVAPQEIIVVDDGSDDETEAVFLAWAEKFDTTQLIYVYQENKGVSAARNVGLGRATSSWVALLDSDDEWLPTRLEKQMALLEQDQSLFIVHGEEIWIRNGKRVNPMKKHAKSGGDIFQRCLPLCCVSPSAVLIHQSVFNDVGLFREDFAVCEDYDLWLKVSSKYRFGFVEEPIIVKYGGADDQLSRQYVAMDFFRVVALDDAVRRLSLNETQKAAALSEINRKSAILLDGYQKHNNLENYDQIKAIALMSRKTAENSASHHLD